MSNEITHTGSVEIEGASDAFRAELAGILQNTTLPVVIRIGNRKCMVVLLPPEAPTALFPAVPADITTTLHKARYGELKKSLKKIAAKLELGDGETVHAERVLWITNELRRNGIDVKFETVRTRLRQIGYYVETNR